MPTMTNTLEISDENNPHLQFEKWKLSPLERSGGRVALEIAFMDLNPQRNEPAKSVLLSSTPSKGKASSSII